MKGLGPGLRQVFVSSDLVSLKKENNKHSHRLCVSVTRKVREGAQSETWATRMPVIAFFFFF